MELPSLPQDKANHAVYGAAIASVGSLYSVWVGLGLCIALAILKEASDWWQNSHNNGHHGVELNDALATIFGGVLVALPQLAKWVK